MILPWILLGILNFLDIWTTYEALELGGTEMNPFSSWLIDHGWFIQYKVFAIVLVGLTGLLVLKKRTSAEIRWYTKMMWVVTGLYVLVVSWNLYSLAMV